MSQEQLQVFLSKVKNDFQLQEMLAAAHTPVMLVVLPRGKASI